VSDSPSDPIYDLAVFERSTQGRFPENALLSHDLIEGAFA